MTQSLTPPSKPPVPLFIGIFADGRGTSMKIFYVPPVGPPITIEETTEYDPFDTKDPFAETDHPLADSDDGRT